MIKCSIDTSNRSGMGKCNICGKYITKNNLPSHKKLHFGEKPYYCDICAKSFSRRIDLKRHMKIHGPREKLGLILSCMKFLYPYFYIHTYLFKLDIMIVLNLEKREVP